jgi:hypothetical protein
VGQPGRQQGAMKSWKKNGANRQVTSGERMQLAMLHSPGSAKDGTSQYGCKADAGLTKEREWRARCSDV